MRNKYHSAVKFYSDSKNEEQLDIAYKEIEKFMINFDKFEWNFVFDPTEIPLEFLKEVPENLR